MRCFASLGLLIAVVGCASSHPESVRPATESVRVIGGSDGGMGNMRMSSSDGAARVTVAFPLDAVWSILPAVYDSLGIPVSTIDPNRRLIGNPGFTVHKRLGSTSLARYIDCGRTQGFPSADSYDIYLSITTHAETGKAPGSTAVSTLLEAAGRPMAFAGEYTKCSTLGALESAINDALRKKLASKG
jgi:hypothetical protein